MTTPNPGSKEAREIGCTCPVMDNHYGKGFEMNGKTVFWHSQDCPVHFKKVAELSSAESADNVSLCPSCNCMTKTIGGKCGKCEAVKENE